MKYFVIVLMLLVQGCGGGKMVSLNWIPPTHYMDGSELAIEEIRSYELRWGLSPDDLSYSLILPAHINNYSTILEDGEIRYFSIATITIYNTKSEPSNIVKRGY